jgi:uncharacterized membrane protein YdjX (TVP38/TMEM64 family)
MPEQKDSRFFTSGRVLLLLAVIAAITLFFLSGWHRELTFESIQERRDQLKEQVGEHLVLAGLVFFITYVLVTALSLPVATVLSLLGGFLFDLWLGVLLVSFASTTGATLAFVGSRYLFRDLVQRRFARWFDVINRGLEKDGIYYLLTLRLTPAVPFFVVNLVMGLTQLPVRTFWWVSQIGMLPATVIYVNAGKQLGSITSPRDILTWPLLVSLALLGIAPLLFRLVVNWWNCRAARSS